LGFFTFLVLLLFGFRKIWFFTLLVSFFSILVCVGEMVIELMVSIFMALALSDCLSQQDLIYLTRVEGNWSMELHNLTWSATERKHLAEVPLSGLRTDDVGTSAYQIFAHGRAEMLRLGFNEHNTMLYRKKEIPTFCKNIVDLLFANDSLRLHSPIIRLHRQNPGQFIPFHVDAYGEYLFETSVAPHDVPFIQRFLIFLEEGAPGHVFQVGDTVFSQWRAGDVIRWRHGLPHLSMNGGTAPKYTLQITGIRRFEN
jgi:hypothetical protein